MSAIMLDTCGLIWLVNGGGRIIIATGIRKKQGTNPPSGSDMSDKSSEIQIIAQGVRLVPMLPCIANNPVADQIIHGFPVPGTRPF
jgi:hypothetical protein